MKIGSKIALFYTVITVGAIALIFIIRKYFFVPSFGQKLPGGETAPDMKKAPEECPEADA